MKLTCLAFTAVSCAFAADCVQVDLDRFHELDKKAQVEFRHSEYAQSAEDFRQAACLAPDDLRSYYRLYGEAIGALAEGNLSSAIERLKQADGLRPDYPLPLAMLVKVSLQSPDPDQVKEFLRLAAERFPRAGKLHAEFVKDLMHQNRLDLALAEVLRFEGSGVQDPESALTLAVIENNAGAFGDACWHAQAIEQQSELPAAARASGATVAGLAYENLSQYTEAIQHFKRAIELAPEREDPYLYLARVYGKKHNFPAMVAILEQARKQITGSVKIELALGAGLVSVERYGEAVQILTEVVRNSPDELDAYPNLAEAYRNTGEPKLATDTMRKLARRKPDYPMVHLVIARSKSQEDPVDSAGVLQELDLAEKATPDDYEVYYLRGKVYLGMSKFTEAIASLLRAIELRPTDSSAHYQLALAYNKSGQRALAARQFEAVKYLESQ
jgi:tetratricopeptide (TPR) repeat protein